MKLIVFLFLKDGLVMKTENHKTHKSHVRSMFQLMIQQQYPEENADLNKPS